MIVNMKLLDKRVYGGMFEDKYYFKIDNCGIIDTIQVCSRIYYKYEIGDELVKEDVLT